MAGNNNNNPATWFQFLNYDDAGMNECRKDYALLVKKEIERPEALDFDTFETVNNGRAARELRKFCRIKFSNDSGKFTCSAWLRLFQISEPVIPEYVREFLASVEFSENVLSITERCLYFQLGGVRRYMTMREFMLAMGLYTEEELESPMFEDFYDECMIEKPNDYNPTDYFNRISTTSGYNSKHPPSYTLIRSPIRRLVHRLIAFSVKGRHSAREKMTVDDLYMLNGMDGGSLIDVPWHLAKFMSGGAKGFQKKSMIQGAHLIGRLARSLGLMTPEALSLVTISMDTNLIGISKLVEYGICKVNALGRGELIPEAPHGGGEGASGSQASGSQAGAEGEQVRMRPTMSISDRFRVIDGRLGHMESSMTQFGEDMDDMAAAMYGMSTQFDSFYNDYRQMQVQQQEYNQWNADRTSEMLASMHLSYPRWNGPAYVYVPDIPDVGVQQGVAFMHPQQAPGSTSSTPYDASQYQSPMDHDHNQE